MHRRSGCFALLVLALYGSVTFATLATDSQAGTRKGRADAGKEAVPGRTLPTLLPTWRSPLLTGSEANLFQPIAKE